MNKQTEALKMAIEAMAGMNNARPDKPLTMLSALAKLEEAIQACKEALEQEEVSDAELVSYRQGYEQGRFDYEMDLELGKIKHPAPSWQELSNDEILTIMNYPEYDEEVDMIDFARAIEIALKEKNGR